MRSRGKKSTNQYEKLAKNDKNDMNDMNDKNDENDENDNDMNDKNDMNDENDKNDKNDDELTVPAPGVILNVWTRDRHSSSTSNLMRWKGKHSFSRAAGDGR